MKPKCKEEIFEQLKDYEKIEEIKAEKYGKYINLRITQKSYIEFSEKSMLWIFDEFKYFPEGMYGRIVRFQNGGDNFDFETMGIEQNVFIPTTGNNLNEMMINISGEGWKNLKNTSLFNFIEKKF